MRFFSFFYIQLYTEERRERTSFLSSRSFFLILFVPCEELEDHERYSSEQADEAAPLHPSDMLFSRVGLLAIDECDDRHDEDDPSIPGYVPDVHEIVSFCRSQLCTLI